MGQNVFNQEQFGGKLMKLNKAFFRVDGSLFLLLSGTKLKTINLRGQIGF